MKISKTEQAQLNHRLSQKVKEYESKTKSLEQLLWELYRIRKEITVLCDSLGIDIALKPIKDISEDGQNNQ